jgi:lipopolysaccharide/colanic/teichoic acid biosynthesis glycosyltransferase
MKLLRKIKSRNKNHYLSLIDDKNVWQKSEAFSEMVKKELNRSRRSGLPISSVVIDLSTDRMVRIPDKGYNGFLNELIKVLTENTRYFDIKYFSNPYKIGILLIDTNLEGAKVFIEKISRILHEHCQLLEMPEYFKYVNSTTVFVSPLGETEKYETISTTLVPEGLEKGENTVDTESHEQESRRDRTDHLDWRTEPYSKNDVIQNIDVITDSRCTGRCIFCFRGLKRMIDLVGATVGMIVFFPCMIFISIAIKATSKGPVFFKQHRVGYLGKSFTFLKFRTMQTNGDDAVHREYVKKLVNGYNDEVNQGTKDEPLYKLDNDSRVTRVGWVLRKTSLDELPQFYNVLAGDMSLVGPRPAIYYEAEEYKNWHWLRVMETKPGITGIWQVSGRSRTTFDEMVRLDLQYIEKQSIMLDMKILFKTFGAVLNTKGAL